MGLFKKAKSIVLTCPFCGYQQEEPSAVVSTYCRSCSEHYRVRKGVAVAGPGRRASGISLIDEEEPAPKSILPFQDPSAPQEVGDSDAWIVTMEDGEPRPGDLGHEDSESEPPVGISAGAFFGLVDEEAVEQEWTSQGEPQINLGAEAESTPDENTLAGGSMAAMIGGQTVEPEAGEATHDLPETSKKPPRKTKRSSESSHEFAARCFRCYHVQRVSRFAKSTQCERCSVYISLANYEIRQKKQQTLRTRGDINITRRGGLVDCEVACHNLMMSGTFNARLDCSGDAVFKASGVVRGPVHCRRLIIDKKVEVEFPDGVLTEKAEIHGTLRGDLTCSGVAKVHRGGRVTGTLKAVSVDLSSGGKIDGEMVQKPDIKTDLPVKMGYNSTVIS
ncbi:MAG: polymer-forming cytoskeletal protein [Verrucomicrobiota bacterium]